MSIQGTRLPLCPTWEEAHDTAQAKQNFNKICLNIIGPVFTGPAKRWQQFNAASERGGVRHTCQNLHSYYAQNLRFLLPYL